MSTTALTGRSSIVIDLKNIETLATKLKEVLDDLAILDSTKWSFGTGANQANVLLHEKLTIAAGANQTLNLFDTAASALQDAHGNDLTMAAIKLLYIKNTSADLYVDVFGGVSLDLLIMGGTADAVRIKPGGKFYWEDPTAAGTVTSTNKNLLFTVAAGSGNAIINVVALGLD